MKSKSRVGKRHITKKCDAAPTVRPREIRAAATTPAVRKNDAVPVEIEKQTVSEPLLTGAVLLNFEVAAATHGSRPCLRLGRQLTLDAMEALSAAEPYRGLSFQTIHSQCDEADNVPLDFKELKRKASIEMRLQFDDAFCMMRPTVMESRLAISAFIIGIRKRPNGLTRRQRNVPIVPASPIFDLPVILDVGEAAKPVRQAVARMWSWSDIAASTMRTEMDNAFLSLRVEAARLLTPLDRTMFGTGRGKRLASTLKRLLRLKAELLDIAQTCEIRPEAVPSRLASLPANDAGDRIQLPVIVLP